MQKTPVALGQWKAVMGCNPASFPDGGDNCLVESLSWNECQEFIRRLNAGKGSVYRLPTEAEWEYACRAGSLTPFCNGEISELYCAHDPLLSVVGWYCGNSGRKSRPVAQKSPNALGLYDMHGNICEWCQDWYARGGRLLLLVSAPRSSILQSPPLTCSPIASSPSASSAVKPFGTREKSSNPAICAIPPLPPPQCLSDSLTSAFPFQVTGFPILLFTCS